MLSIWVRMDAAGVRPVLREDGDALECALGEEWFFVAAVADRVEGARLCEQLRQAYSGGSPNAAAPEPELFVDEVA